ncbi:hypothetical protein HZH66_002409 [Vespula vulgaris]|uniref:Uncharacterized protein n=2 Tax=Vespula TaxID=7451 RepID=A0A834KJW4_VESVU|nr:hypothetical protein HZH66_002409 [Vespula vulgaris]
MDDRKRIRVLFLVSKLSHFNDLVTAFAIDFNPKEFPISDRPGPPLIAASILRADLVKDFQGDISIIQHYLRGILVITSSTESTMRRIGWNIILYSSDYSIPICKETLESMPK